MKVIIAGSRAGVTYKDIEEAVDSLEAKYANITDIVSGCDA